MGCCSGKEGGMGDKGAVFESKLHDEALSSLSPSLLITIISSFRASLNRLLLEALRRQKSKIVIIYFISIPIKSNNKIIEKNPTAVTSIRLLAAINQVCIRDVITIAAVSCSILRERTAGPTDCPTDRPTNRSFET